ncbi:MAG: exodeoxyribonuclease III [Bacteroidetes bacterium]|nr:MAG: exodeoxyribonuclease III [Bacteroidota bacterium]
MPTKIISYNVNGIRAAMTKDLCGWLEAANPDVFCLQEIKATPDQVDVAAFEKLGYQLFWNPAEKKGYSGTAIFTKHKPKHVEIGCGIPIYDFEGRVIRADYEDFSVMNVYMPSGSSGEERQDFKFKWLADFYVYIQNLIKTIPNLIIVGDYNICHRAIDIHNPKSNAQTSGFLPEEREWMEKFFTNGFIDTFRHFNTEPHNYTWWSYRAGARGKNLGWRIDYQAATMPMKERLKRALILPDAKHSDHCPTLLEIN